MKFSDETSRLLHPTNPHPPVATKSADDLKSILRTMTAKNIAEKQEKQTQNQQSLKGTLAEVLAKNNEKQPFEVPEDTLRKVLKGEK